MELLQPAIDQLTSGLVALLLALASTLILAGLRYVHRKTGLVDGEAMLNAETLLNATIEANVRHQEQASREIEKTGQEKPRGVDKELNAINGVLDDLKEAAVQPGATIAKNALKLASGARIQKGIKGLVGKLF